MDHTIKTLYIIHHSHTDIGYTDLQERVLSFQVSHIREVLRILIQDENKEFRWNCESFFCVERFLEEATREEEELFFQFVREKKIGLSGTYLNFTDLVDHTILKERLKSIQEMLVNQGIDMKTAMFADINGISMGQRDVLIENGIEFLYTNIHTHHGMYPIYQNQNAFWWENQKGERLFIWNGEHYNLGNALGLKAEKNIYWMAKTYFGEQKCKDDLEKFYNNLETYLVECEENGYPYDFIISSISGVFSDNAPPNPDILRMIELYQQTYPNGIQIKMVTISELYEAIKQRHLDVPVYRGDMTDWWANGVGSTPYPVKHYKEAQRLYHLAGRLDPDVYKKYPVITKEAQNHFLLYAEHTWGHSASITDPYETMVLNLDMRKSSYASRANEESAKLHGYALDAIGAKKHYYNTSGKVCVVNTGNESGNMLVEFYIETIALGGVQVIEENSKDDMSVQLSPHPRGILISFVDYFRANEKKTYSFREVKKKEEVYNSRVVYMGSERVKDIVNDYDNKSYRLPYELENKWFYIRYEIGKGIISFQKKGEDGSIEYDMLSEGLAKFFTPIYERTEIRKGIYQERHVLGRNIRGLHAEQFQGKLIDVKCVEKGEVFTLIELIFELEGTRNCVMRLKLYEKLPRIDFTLRLAKELSEDIESIYLPLQLNLPNRQVYLKKGSEAFRPGVDQLPGTNMEYWMSDTGIVYESEKENILVYTLDTPLLYMGEMKHHPIQLCNQKKENNQRNVYSWIMNNTWETNFKTDLSGYCEFCYRVELAKHHDIESCFDEMLDQSLGTVTYMIDEF